VLDIWILNVGHGDSIILHLHGDEADTFAVIDSNTEGTQPPRALEKLYSLGADRLSFVALTHPHADHYSGLREICRQFSGRISNFYCFPFGPFVKGRLKKLAEAYAAALNKTDSERFRRNLKEFILLMTQVNQDFGEEKWIELDGHFNDIFPEGFKGVDIISILPPADAKGYFMQLLDHGSLDHVGNRSKENDLSAAFLVRFGGAEIVLGGDGTTTNWLKLAKAWSRKDWNLSADAVKLPHHGSKGDNPPKVLDNFFGDGHRIGVISANGRSHPHADVLASLDELNIKPYCTNLSQHCGGKFREQFSAPELAPRLLRFISTMREPSPSFKNPCQGDICLSISDNGEVTVTSEFDNACPYRADSNLGLSALFTPHSE